MRRTDISTMCMAAALVFAASCNKIDENILSVDGNGRTVINGVAEAVGGGTKAYNRYSYDVLWNECDRIYVTDGTEDDTFTLTDGEDTPDGVFTEDNAKGISGDIEAYYPASLKTDGGYVWPAVQTNNQVAPMYANQAITGAGNEVVSFSSLGAMLQIVFSTKAEGITVTSITLKDESKPLSGIFTVSDGQAIMAENSDNPGVTLDLAGSAVAVGVAAKYFYLAIPAGEYNGDRLTLTFTDDVHHKECVMTSTAFPDVKRNTVGRITLGSNDFTIQKRTVKFDLNNTGLTGKFNCPADLAVEYNSTFKQKYAFAENYCFRGWYKDATCENAWDFDRDKVTSDITLYAKWVPDLTQTVFKYNHECVKLGGYFWATTDNYDTVSSWRDALTEVEIKWGELGNPWNYPSRAAWKALVDNCVWTYEGNSQSGVFKVTGKEENFEAGHSLSFPEGPTAYYWAQEGYDCYYVRLFGSYTGNVNFTFGTVDDDDTDGEFFLRLIAEQ